MHWSGILTPWWKPEQFEWLSQISPAARSRDLYPFLTHRMYKLSFICWLFLKSTLGYTNYKTSHCKYQKGTTERQYFIPVVPFSLNTINNYDFQFALSNCSRHNASCHRTYWTKCLSCLSKSSKRPNLGDFQVHMDAYIRAPLNRMSGLLERKIHLF